jgi:Fe-S-cluster containining protein
METEHGFKRTTCACDGCVQCCRRQPGSLAGGDFQRIAGFIAEKQKWTREVAFAWLKRQLWASPGALVKAGDAVVRVGTITPRKRDGQCVFLGLKNECTIHGVAPFGCSHFDIHMSRTEAMPRSLWLVRSQLDPAYQVLRDELPPATSYKPNAY